MHITELSKSNTPCFSHYTGSVWHIYLALWLVACLSAGSVSANDDDASLSLWHRNFDTAPVDKILELALDKTLDLYPPASVKRSPPIEYRKAIESLKSNDGEITILSAASSIENDAQFYAIPFPVLKGLLGTRLCLIRKGDQRRFNRVLTAHDFKSKNLNICQGKDWPDAKILARNGLPLVTSAKYQDLFTLLYEGQCDCFLRGAQEIVPEYLARESLLDIEASFAITYSEPGFFYVNRSNPTLAARIELGLLRALDEGSYDQLFEELMGEHIQFLDLPNRKEIRLVNPEPSPINEASQAIDNFWYSP